MRIVVLKGSCGIAAGAGKVYDAIAAEIAKTGDVELGSTGCIGMCFLEPIVDIYEGKEHSRECGSHRGRCPHRRCFQGG